MTFVNTDTRSRFSTLTSSASVLGIHFINIDRQTDRQTTRVLIFYFSREEEKDGERQRYTETDTERDRVIHIEA